MEQRLRFLKFELKKQIDWFFTNYISDSQSDSQIISNLNCHLDTFWYKISNELHNFTLKWNIEVKDMVVIIHFEIYLYNNCINYGFIKKAVVRIVTDNSYHNLFSEMGVNDKSVDIAIMSAKLKIQNLLTK